MDKIEEEIKLARFIVEYNSDNTILSTLIFDGVAYSYTMRENEEGGFTSDNLVFNYQVRERFPDLYPEEVLDLISEVSYYINSDELEELLFKLGHYE